MKGRTLLLVASALAGCHQSAPAPAGSVELVGYRALRATAEGTSAWFSSRKRPIVSLAGTRFESAVWRQDDGGETALAARAPVMRDGRQLIELIGEAPVGPGELVVRHSGGRFELTAFWLDEDAPWKARLAAAAADGVAALQATDPQSLFADTPAAIRPFAEQSRASRIARGGTLDVGVAALRAAARSAETRGHYTQAASAHRTAAFYLLDAGRLLDAVAALEASRAVIGALPDPRGRVREAYYQARFDASLSRLGRAVDTLSTATMEAWRIGDGSAVSDFAGHLVGWLGRLGRFEEALELIERHPAPKSAYSAWFRRLNRQWIRLQAMRACHLPRDYAAVRLALREVADSAPASIRARSRANAWVNVAYAAWLMGDARGGLDALSRAQGPGIHPDFTRILHTSLRLAAGEVDGAIEDFRRLAERGRARGPRGGELEWRALYGLGRAQSQRGATDAALGAWMAALSARSRYGDRLGVAEGLSSFHGARRELGDALVRTLVRRGALEEALRIADFDRAPVLRRIAADARLGQLDGERLRAWRARVDGYRRAQAEADRARERCESAPVSQAESCGARAARAQRHAERALDAVYAQEPSAGAAPEDRASIRQALGEHTQLLFDLRVRRPDRCDFVRRSLLIDRAGVRTGVHGIDPERHLYLVGLPRPPPEVAVQSWSIVPTAAWLARRGRAPVGPSLLVADPGSDLLEARRLGETLPSDRRLIGEAATRSAVLEHLDGARWFHFEGHGDLGEGNPWSAHLELADGRLTVSDVLAGRPRIGTVVLSGCETGRAVALSSTEALGLAEAFLLAGADRVIASDRKVPDVEAARFMERFYGNGAMERPTEAFHATVRQLRAAKDPAAEGWRLFGRR